MENEKPCGCQTNPETQKQKGETENCCGNTETAPDTGCNCGVNQRNSKTGELGGGCTADNTGKPRLTLKNVVPSPGFYRNRRTVKGEVVTVIDVTFESSGIDLVEAWSRAVPKGDIHEIMIWNPLEEGDDAGAIAFIEITQGGNIINGDEVLLNGEAIGTLVGFDYNHMPNHMNIVVETKTLNLPIELNSTIEFIPNPMLPLLDDDKCC